MKSTVQRSRTQDKKFIKSDLIDLGLPPLHGVYMGPQNLMVHDCGDPKAHPPPLKEQLFYKKTTTGLLNVVVSKCVIMR